MQPEMQELSLQGFSYQARQSLLPDLTAAFTQCGGWVLERKTLSAESMVFRIELQLHGIIELYALLVETGLELTRNTHQTLADLCTCRQHIEISRHASQILTLRLELSFLEELTLHSVLATGSPSA